MSRQTAQQQTAEIRHLPTLADVIAALQWLAGKEPDPVPRTIIMKVRKPSRQTKIPRLLSTHVYVTNWKHRILEHYRESLDQQREDGSIAMVLRVQHLGSGRSRMLATYISNEYLKSFLTDEDLRYAGRLREGVCRDVAQILINWVQDITGSILSAATLKTAEDKEQEQQSTKQQPSKKQRKRAARKRSSRRKRDNLMTVEEAYIAWQQKRALWERAAKIPIPFGKYKGIPLGDIGKREARWLMERLLPVDEIKKTLEFVEHLIVDPNAITEDVAYEEHLYLRDGGHEFKHRRAVRAHRLAQRILDPPGELVLLGMLHKDELQQVRNELQILRNAGEQFESLLPSLHEGLQEAQQLAEFSDFEDGAFKNFREVFETFLYEKPPDYPEIPQADVTDEQVQALHEKYGASLRWFQPNPKKPGDVEKYVDEKREARARERLLQAHGQLILPALQPIPFLGTMHPAHYSEKHAKTIPASSRDFALLFDSETGEYVAAVWLRGRKDPVTPEEQAERRQKRENQKHIGRLYYANFPETPFEPSDQSSYMLLPLEWGEQSNRRRFREQRQPLLAQLIERQHALQHQRHAELHTPEHPRPIEQCLPKETAFQSGRLVMNWDEKGNPEFFLHIKVALPTTQPEQIPETIMGFHEHEDGYSFAEVHLDGTVVRTGDLTIPKHVDPANGAKKSDNYVYEIAHAMLTEAGTAYIGIEDTSYQKDDVSLDRQRNRAIFGRPSGRIRTTLETKGKEIGVLPPRLVGDVSPGRDCGACQVRHPKGTLCRERRQMVMCPNEQCQTWQVWHAGTAEQQCSTCRHTWRVAPDEIATEWYFVCPDCQQPALPARYNTAIVVAQETLRELKRHWQNGLAYEQRKERERQRKAAAAQQAQQASAPSGA